VFLLKTIKEPDLCYRQEEEIQINNQQRTSVAFWPSQLKGAYTEPIGIGPESSC
jgi:hypothetical protein